MPGEIIDGDAGHGKSACLLIHSFVFYFGTDQVLIFQFKLHFDVPPVSLEKYEQVTHLVLPYEGEFTHCTSNG